MPKLNVNVPKMCRHLHGQAFVKIGGQQIWLGRYGDPLTQEKYDRLVGQWLANGRTLPAPSVPPAQPVTVLQILAPYWRWARPRYQPGELDSIKGALRIVERLYGSTPALDFGPNAFRAVRAEMIRRAWTRKSINRQMSRVRALFRWAASHELLPESVFRQLQTVEPLRHGEASERPKVRIVARRLIRVVRHRVSRQVRALIDLQLLTGARADELLGIRGSSIERRRIDQGHIIWAYHCVNHKTAHQDKERWIYFGPRAQKILKMFLTADRPAACFIFSPRDAERERHSTASAHRRPGQKSNARQTDREVGDRYSTPSYRRAIHRALSEAFPTPKHLCPDERKLWRSSHTWGPHRLRHNAGTYLRREFGVEVARAILGHSSAITTLIYCEEDERRAMRAISKVG
jgi:site-specific recombinase XerD